jgi:hypothetical protein
VRLFRRRKGDIVNFFIPLFLALALASCSGGLDQKLDGTSEAAYKATLEKARKVLSEKDRKELEEALRVLAISDVSIGFEGGILGAMQKMQGKPAEGLGDAILAQVNGKTGREVVAAAAERRKAQAERQLLAVKAEAAALKKARAEKETAKDFLAKIEVQEPRIAIMGEGVQRMAILDFKVANGSEETLSSLFLRASVTDADGKVLMTDEFTYKASPPIAMQQTREVRLPSSTPGKWNSPELAKQAQLGLKMHVENASTAAGSKLATSFTQKDADRLALLEKQQPQLEALAAGK